MPCDGELWYRGYNVKTLIKSIGPNEFGFEKAAYLLLFGELPDQAQLDEFCEVLGNSRTLPTNFTRDVIMKAPSKDIMNSMTRSILTLAAYDPYTTDSSIENNIRQCMQLIANFPMIAAYGYHAYNHYEMIRVCIFTDRTRSFPRQRISFVCCGRISSIHSWRHRCLMWH